MGNRTSEAARLSFRLDLEYISDRKSIRGQYCVDARISLGSKSSVQQASEFESLAVACLRGTGGRKVILAVI